MTQLRKVEYITPDKQKHIIEYTLTIKNVKNINMRMKPDGSIYVSAHIGINPDYIDEFVRSKGAELLNTRNKFQNKEEVVAKEDKTREVEYTSFDNSNHTIKYNLSLKQVKNINLRIKPDGSIHVSANPRVTLEYIDKFVLSKGEFILEALEEYKTRETCAIEDLSYKTGENFYYLGTAYPILVLQSEENVAQILDDKFVIKVSDLTNFKQKERIVEIFIHSNCADTFNELSVKVYGMYSKYKIPFPKLKMQDMKSQWGSCSKHKCIVKLNKRLIHSPIKSIEYVIVHEFAHLIHADHSKAFHGVVADIMPDWKKHKEALISF